MNQKIIYTRISSKYDDYANWLELNPVLLQGEFAIAVDPSDKEHPKILVKAGDGKHTYRDLPFISSNSIDVPQWAKSNTKPVYTAEEIVGLDKYISSNGGTTTECTDTNTQYDIIKIDDYTYQFVAKNINDTEYTKITTIDIPKFPIVEKTQEIVTEEGSGIILTNTDDGKVNIAVDTSVINCNNKELITEEGSGIILTNTDTGKLNISIDTAILDNDDCVKEITTEDGSGIILTNTDDGKVNIAVDTSVIGNTCEGKEIVTDEGSGIILTNTDDGKVNIAVDTSVVGDVCEGQKITTSENSGILLKQLENNTVDISLNNEIVYILNGGTAASFR